jgi:hypothetical protein
MSFSLHVHLGVNVDLGQLALAAVLLLNSL